MSAPWIQQLYLDPFTESRRVGVRYGEFVIAPFLLPTPGTSGDKELASRQLEELFSMLDATLAVAEAGQENLLRITCYVRDAAARALFNAAYLERFPDRSGRPPHKALPAPLPEGVDVALAAIAMIGSEHEVLALPGVLEDEPMSVGARVGGVVASSRLASEQSELDAAFAQLLEFASALLGAGTGGAAELTQATFFVADESQADAVAALAEREWGSSANAPATHLRTAGLGGGAAGPRLEILGLVPPEG